MNNTVTARELSWALTPRVVQVRKRTRASALEAPPSTELPIGRREDGTLATIPTERLVGGLITGRAGAGKSATLANLILQIAFHREGEAVVLLDPHHDLAALMAEHLRADPWQARRTVDLQLGGDGVQPGLNLLAPVRPVPDHVIAREVVAAVTGAMGWRGEFRRLSGIISLSTRTLLQLNKLLPSELQVTLLEVPLLLGDKDWRASVLQALPADMRSSWSHDLPKDAVQNVLSAIEGFRAEPGPLALLGQSVTTLDVSEALDHGRVLLIRPGRGAAGVTNLLLSAITEALLARAESSRFRTPARIFVDEAQQVGPALSQQLVRLLEQARKFGASVVLATQSPQRISELLLHALETNRSFMSTFALSALSARALAAEMGGEVDWQRIVRLPLHTALFDRGHGAPIEVESIRPAELHGKPSSPRADFDRTGWRSPDEVEREIRERPQKILEALGAGTSKTQHDHLTPAERRRLIRTMSAQGASQREIARELGLARITVQKALGRRRGGSPSTSAAIVKLEA